MAKKKSSTAAAATSSSSSKTSSVDKDPSSTAEAAAPAPAATAADEEEEMELLQVELGDMVKMKQVLDEAVIQAVIEKLPEDTRWDNFKLGLMLASCIFAMIAQFAPLPFPESRPVLGVCGSLYFILSGLLQFITTFIDKDAIVWIQPSVKYNNNNNNNKKKDDNQECAVCVRSNFPRFSEYYTVTMELLVPSLSDDDNKKGQTTTTGPSVTQTWSVGLFFDKEGYFYEAGIMDETKKLLAKLQAGKYDKKDASNKPKQE